MNEWETCIDEWATRCREKDAQITSLQTALDAERGKVENLEHKIQARGGLALIDDARAKAGLYDQLATQLSQLQALVRALYQDLPTKRDWLDPVLEARMKATLNATTPAPETSIIGKCVPPSQYDQNAQVRGDIS